MKKSKIEGNPQVKTWGLNAKTTPPTGGGANHYSRLGLMRARGIGVFFS